jgi:hypothetical protein
LERRHVPAPVGSRLAQIPKQLQAARLAYQRFTCGRHADRLEQDVQGLRLGKKSVGATLQTAGQALLVTRPAEHDHTGAINRERLNQKGTVASGGSQVEVKQNHVRPVARGRSENLGGAESGNDYVHALGVEGKSKALGEQVVVFDDQHADGTKHLRRHAHGAATP